MTMRLDIVTNDAGEGVRREHARELGAGVVIAIYRLTKLAQLHDLTNQAFTRQLEQTHQIIGDYCLRSGSNVNVMFAHKAVFVAGQLLKGSRSTYEAASELGELFERLGGSELHIQRDLTRAELLGFAEQISISYRSAAPFRSTTPKVRLRAVADAARLRGLELEVLSDHQRIVRMYASAVVILRRFYEDLQASRYILPRRIKRIAQSLVDLSEGSTPAFLGVTEVRNANFDEAGRAVNTAILAVSMAREVTQDRAVLSQIAMAGMMHDVARPRAMALSQAAGPAMPGMQGPSVLSEDQEDRLAAGAVAVLTALGRVNEPSITRTVLTFEALWLRRQGWLGPVYWGARAPTLHAKLIAVARRYNDLLTPEPGLAPPTPDYAVASLSEELKDPQDRTVLRMLVSTLGLVPMGTVVQLSSGEVAEVVRGPKGASEDARVRLLTDASGKPLPAGQGFELELSDEPHRAVTRIVSVDGWRKGRSLRGSEAPELTPPESVSVRSVEQSSSASFSLGSSPSSVAGAMGRMIDESLRAAGPPADPGDDERTLFKHAPEEGAERNANRAASGRPPREPTARGNLATTPLPHVLVYMLDHRLTGSVVFEGGEGEDAIYFVEGVPTKVRLHHPFALLGELLVHGGLLAASVVDQAVPVARRLGVPLGEYLVGHDMLTREALSWALEAQLLHKVASLANLAPDITYAYYRELDLLDGWGGGDIQVGCALSPVLASVRNWMDRVRVRATLNRIGKHPLALHESASLANLALVPEEQGTLDMLRSESIPLAQLFARNVADEETVSSLVYALAVTRQFAFKGQTKGPMGARTDAAGSSASAASSPPAPSGSIPVETLSSASQGSMPPTVAAGRLRAQPPAAMPPAGRLPSDARASAAPAPMPRPMQPAARPPASASSARGSPPQNRPVIVRKSTIVGIPLPGTLEQRKAVARPASPASARPDALRASEQPQPAAAVASADDGLAGATLALEAMRSFRLADAALLKNDLATAENLAQRAVSADPTQLDYAALLAFIRSLGENPSAAGTAITTMTEILAEDPSNERALLYRGKILARSNRHEEALSDFSALLVLNPRHREAQSELHLLTTEP